MRRWMTSILQEAGFATPEVRKVAVAIAWAESSGFPDMHGDVLLQDAKWGPSIGLFQVRSLKADSGTGRERDALRLEDPLFNAKAAFSISKGGTDWTPWSVYTKPDPDNPAKKIYEKYLTKGDFIVQWPVELLLRELADDVSALARDVLKGNNLAAHLPSDLMARIGALQVKLTDTKLFTLQ